MKKYLKLMLLAFSSFCLTISAQAQMDVFSGVRTLIVDSPRTLLVSATPLVTNSWVDIHGFEGIAKIDFTSKTNAGGGTVTVQVQTSQDQTNFTTLANVAYATGVSATITNWMYGSTNLTATDVFNIPGTVTTPTAATAGWSTPYILPAPFTNTVSALSLTADGVNTIGFNISDANRYIRLIYTTGGTVTNSTISAVLTARRHVVP